MKALKPAISIVLFNLVACASGPVSVNPSHQDMSLALRTMSITGNDKYFVDVDREYFDEATLNGSFNPDTPVFDTLAAVGYYTDTLSSIGNSGALLSNNQKGALQLAISMLENEKVTKQRLNQSVFAWIPKNEVRSKSEAIDVFAKSLISAVAKNDGLDVSDVRIVRVTEHGLNGWRLYTNEKIFVEGHGYVEQGHFEKTGLPCRAAFLVHGAEPTIGDPVDPLNDSYLVTATFGVTNPDDVDQDKKRLADLVEISRLMPEWYYQFLFIEKVPVVLHAKKLNFFIKPSKEKSTRQASTSN